MCFFRKIIIVLNLASWCLIGYAQPPIGGFTENDYVPGKIIFKMKETQRTKCSQNDINNELLKELFNDINAVNISKKFPNHNPPDMVINPTGESYADLSLIYEIDYKSDVPIEKVISSFLTTGAVEYAQPRFISHPFYVPNDPQANDSTGAQYHLKQIMAYQGWDIEKGDSSVVIGITDTGFDTDHPDIAANIATNYLDPQNGIDDDNDGFTDNFRGWDLGNYDNDPSGIYHPTFGYIHGAWVSGVSSSVTDNATGGAGTGFKSRFLPIKIGPDETAITHGSEGIVYAADHGCSVINCSWGGDFTGPFEQDAINYAVLNRNAVVVAAAGNCADGCTTPLFPASLNNVISVAGVDNNDVRFNINPTNGSSYGPYVDISAPASAYTTAYDNTYGTVGPGTSIATPVVSGCVALVRKRFPLWSALQVSEQIKVTADNIDTIAGNVQYTKNIGYGRINLYNALTDTLKPSVVMTRKILSGKSGNQYLPGDTVWLSGRFTNYLAQASALSVKFEVLKGAVTPVSDSIFVGLLGTMDTVNNYATPFALIVNSNATVNDTVLLRILFRNSSVAVGYDHVEFAVNQGFLNISVNDISTTVVGNGRIGYSNNFYQGGLGFIFKNNITMLYESGFMIGKKSTGSNAIVLDNIVGVNGQDKDFNIVSPIKKSDPSVRSDFDGEGIFDDGGAIPADKLFLKVLQKVFAWKSAPDNRFVILEYNIINYGSGNADSIYTGLFADWDIMDFNLNKADFDTTRKLGYVWSTQFGSNFTGISVLSSQKANQYALDLVAGGNGGVDVYYPQKYTTDKKHTTLSQSRIQAGNFKAGGNDIAHVVSAGPFSINAGDTVKVAFALIAGEDLNDLKNNSDKAHLKYDTTYTAVESGETDIQPEITIYPNPGNGEFTLRIITTKYEFVRKNDPIAIGLRIMNILGVVVYNQENSSQKPATSNQQPETSINLNHLPSGIYFCSIQTSDGIYMTKLIKY